MSKQYIIEFPDDQELGTEGTIRYRVTDGEQDVEWMAERERLKNDNRYLSKRIAHLEGVIDGLKFAIRCDGVSGGEVM